ncbi:MAG TPA: metallophosphoesterase [Phycisphaerales bacterium]|nr:metallophosphoesterase [Phycisphaerales bacterium]
MNTLGMGSDTMNNTIRSLFSTGGLFVLLALLMTVVAAANGETFSFAVVADPHIGGSADHYSKLNTAVDWIISNKDSRDIELVFVVGDIAWGGPRSRRNLRQAKEMLDRLAGAGIAYLPVIGDNEIQAGCEREFAETFDGQYRRLSKVLPNWRKAPMPVNGKYLQNFSFDYKGCHFVCCDFNSRKHSDEGGELHDFAGGSWPWFKNDIETRPKDKKESIVVFTHIGMFRTGFGKADEFLFSQGEMKKIKGFLWDYKDYVDTNYAGHIHQNWHASVWKGLFTTIYHVRTTDETWFGRQWPEAGDRSATVRVVETDSDGRKVSYKQHVCNAQKP